MNEPQATTATTSRTGRPRLHELPLNEREIKIDRKWAIRITLILVTFVIIAGTMTTVIFMIRKGLW